MKFLSITLAGLLSLAIMMMSHFAWVERTSVSGAGDVNETEEIVVSDVQEGFSTYVKMADHWPREAVVAYEQALADEVPFQVVLVGSESTMGAEYSWAALLTEQLKAHYQETMDITSVHFNRFSGDFDIEEVTSLVPDVVLIEPFLMKDNDWYADVEAPLENIDQWRTSLQETNADVTVLLQPANPFYLPQKYEEQVKALATYAHDQGITYLNHWEAWPHTDDASIADFLTEEYYPNEAGHQLWADYLAEYFIAQ